MTAADTVSVLLIEDDQDDAALVRRALRHAAFPTTLTHVSRIASLRAAAALPWDIVLCDHSLPGLEFSAAIEILAELAPATPIVVVTGTVGEEAVADIMRRGIADVVLKDRLTHRLTAVMEREVANFRQRRAAETRQRRNEAILRIFRDAADWRQAMEASLQLLGTAFAADAACLIETERDPAPTGGAIQPVAAWCAGSAANLAHCMAPIQRPTPSTCTGLGARTVADIASLPPAEAAMLAGVARAGMTALVCQPLPAAGRDFELWLLFRRAPPDLDPIAAELATLSASLQPLLLRTISDSERALLCKALDAAHSGVLITEAAPLREPGPRIVYLNEALANMTGYTRAELIGRSPRIFQGPATRRDTLDQIEAALRAAQPITAQLQNYRRDGSAFWTELDITPVHDNNRLTHFIAIQTDITERLRTEQERHQREASFRLLFESSPMPMWVYDLETLAFLEVNQAAIASYGWSREEFLARTALSVRPPEERAAFSAALPSPTCPHRTIPATHITATGARMTVRLGVERIQYRGRHANLTVIWDVTELERTRDELRSKNEALDQLTSTLTNRTNELTAAARLARIGTWSMQFKPRRVTWSSELFDIMGQGPDHFVPDSAQILACVHPDDRARFRQHYRRMLRHGGEHQMEFRVIRPKGDVRVLHELSRSKLDDHGNEVGISGVIQDVTEQKLAADALLRSEKLKTLGQITGGIAHDFNNLLTVIGLSIEEALDTTSLPGEVRAVLEPALQATARSSELTGQLLSYARRQSLSPRNVDLQQLVLKLKPLLTRAVGDRNALEVAPASAAVPVLIDPGQFENALMNLVINARDALRSGGKIRLSVTSERVTAELPTVPDQVPPGNHVRIRVADDGEGIPPDLLSRVFEPFFTTKSVGNGSGLGLSMVYGFVHQSGGVLTVASTVGVGTQFDLYFPAVQPDDSSKPEIPAATLSKPRPGFVLLVEDRDVLRQSVHQILRRHGYHVTPVPSPEQALETLRSDRRVDVLLTDVGLQDPLDGTQLAAAAKAIRPNLKVVLMTGDTGMTEAGKLPWEVVPKPFSAATLVTALERSH
jgi:PAS domain S-box-containing protein